MNKKIAFIGVKGIPANFKGVSGIEVGVEKMCLELVKMGYKPVVFVRNWATPRNIKNYYGIKLIHLPTINTKYTDTLIHSFLASLYVCFTDYKVICYRAVGPAFFSFFPRFFGKKVITTVHGADWERKKWGFIAKSFLILAREVALIFSNKIVVVSKDLQKYFYKRGFKTIYIGNGFQYSKRITSKNFLEKLGLKTNNYLLFLGRFVPEKRIEWLIRAYKENNIKIPLVLAGGSSHSDDYVNFLKTQASGSKDIIFSNYVFSKEKEELLSNCRLLVLPSFLEGYSNVVIEALQYRKMVLAADIPANASIISDKAFLFKSNDFSDFSKKLKLLLTGKNQKIKIKREIYENSWEKVAEKYCNISLSL